MEGRGTAQDPRMGDIAYTVIERIKKLGGTPLVKQAVDELVKEGRFAEPDAGLFFAMTEAR